MNRAMIGLPGVACCCVALISGLPHCPADEPSGSETQDRITHAATAVRSNVAVCTLARGQGFASRGEVDLFVASTATWDLAPNDPQLWEPALKLGVTAVERAGMTGNNEPHGPTSSRDFAMYKKHSNPLYVRTDVVYCRRDQDDVGNPTTTMFPQAIMAAGVDDPQSVASSVVVSRGPVSAKVKINSSLVLATSDVAVGDDISDSVVFCEGNVVVTRNVSRSLIVARGRITVKGKVWSGTLVAGERVVTGQVVAPADALDAKMNRLVIEEKATNPLGFISFFELSRVGLEVKAAKGEVQVEKVAAGKPCEKAGVKAGDVVHDVNGKKPTDAESLRRLLRDALAVGDATVKLKRGNEALTVKLSLLE